MPAALKVLRAAVLRTGYGYARSATVTASEPLRLLVLPPRELHDLVRTTPTVARRVQAAARERLRRT